MGSACAGARDKVQVYQLARHLGIPEAIQKRTPTTDTYSAHCDQQEFFFRMPSETLDLLWFALELTVPVPEVAAAMDLTHIQVERAFDDITRKERTTQYLRLSPPVLSVPAAITVLRILTYQPGPSLSPPTRTLLAPR